MKRSQAAMEFLMTYGWAILVVFVVVSTLSYLGFFNFGIFMPKRCIITPGMICEDFEIYYKAITAGPIIIGYRSDFELSIQNGMGYKIWITDVTLDKDGIYTALKSDMVTQGKTDLKINCQNLQGDNRKANPNTLLESDLTKNQEIVNCKLQDFKKNGKVIKEGQEDNIEFNIKYVNERTGLEHTMTATATR